MPALVDELLAKAGYVRLSKYGLMLTPQGHIISLQPCVPDDGSSARIVGWRDGREPVGVLGSADTFVVPPTISRPAMASAGATAGPRAPARPAPPSERRTPPSLPGVRPADEPADDEALWAAALARAKAAAETTAAATAPAPPPVPAKALRPAPKLALVAPPSTPRADSAGDADDSDEGDEWEWQLALARARVAAEESEQAKAPPPALRLSPKPAPQPLPLSATRQPAPAPDPALAAAPTSTPRQPAPVPRQPAPVSPAPVSPRQPAQAPRPSDPVSARPAPAVHIPPRIDRADRPAPPMRANASGWKPPVPPTRRGDTATNVNAVAPSFVAGATSRAGRMARGTGPVDDTSPGVALPPRLSVVSAAASVEPRPLPLPVLDEDTNVDLKPAKYRDTPAALPRLSARR